MPNVLHSNYCEVIHILRLPENAAVGLHCTLPHAFELPVTRPKCVQNFQAKLYRREENIERVRTLSSSTLVLFYTLFEALYILVSVCNMLQPIYYTQSITAKLLHKTYGHPI